MDILGWEADTSSTFGFDQHPATPADSRPITYDGDAPICCVAPTGAGKGRDLLIPILLTDRANLVCLDMKGELSAVCGRARRAMGHRVAILDPFCITSGASDRLNPFDLFGLDGSLLECDAEMLASLLGEGHGSEKEPFWPDTANGINAGLIAHIASAHPPETRNLTALRDYLYHDDLSYHLAVLLDTKQYRSPFVRGEFVGFLQHSADKTRESVLSTATTYVKALGSEQVARTLEDSTIDLASVVEGAPLDIFITVPPSKLKSHRALLRLWVGTLLTAVMSRRAIPERRTLFVLDEAAQLGAGFEPLLTACTLLRGYGLQLLTVWQDLSQVKSRYPADWPTILNNAGALLGFGFSHYSMAKEWSEVTGMDAHELLRLPSDQAVLAVRGEGVRAVKRLNYLRDALFAGKADPNPYFSRTSPLSR